VRSDGSIPIEPSFDQDGFLRERNIEDHPHSFAAKEKTAGLSASFHSDQDDNFEENIRA
jgi:hypothetical protein